MKEEQPKKSYGFLIFLLIILIILLIGTIALVAYNRYGKSNYVNTTNDVANELGNYYVIEDMEDKDSDKFFKSFEVKNVKLSNVSDEAKKEYYSLEKKLLERIDTIKEKTVKEVDYNEKEYIPITSIRSNINGEVNKGVLSIKYSLFDNFESIDDITELENLFTFNYEIKIQKLLTTDELLNIYGLNKNDVATILYEQYIYVEDVRNDVTYIDNQTNKKVDAKYINTNKENYINVIADNLDKVGYFYTSDSGLFVTYKISNILGTCFLVEGDSTEKYDIIKIK